MSQKLGFTLASLATYEWPVDVNVPANGDFETHRFTGIFKHLSHDDAKAMLDRMNAKVAELKSQENEPDSNQGVIDAATLIAENQIELYGDIFIGWGPDLTDEAGNAMACTAETKRRLLGQRIIRDAVIKAHKDSQSGEAVRAKNSGISPEDGQQTGES